MSIFDDLLNLSPLEVLRPSVEVESGPSIVSSRPNVVLEAVLAVDDSLTEIMYGLHNNVSLAHQAESLGQLTARKNIAPPKIAIDEITNDYNTVVAGNALHLNLTEKSDNIQAIETIDAMLEDTRKEDDAITRAQRAVEDARLGKKTALEQAAVPYVALDTDPVESPEAKALREQVALIHQANGKKIGFVSSDDQFAQAA